MEISAIILISLLAAAFVGYVATVKHLKDIVDDFLSFIILIFACLFEYWYVPATFVVTFSILYGLTCM